MSVPAWGKALSVAAGVAAAAGAAQLGAAYGLTVLVWTGKSEDPSGATWAANLTWVCWLAATAVVAGSVVGGRVAESAGLPRSVLTRTAVMLCAAAGSLVTVPLVAIPARYAELAGDASPATTAARIALFGVLLGAVVSIGVLLGRPLAWNVAATNGWLWLLALASVLVSLRGEQPIVVRLAIWSSERPPDWLAVLVPMLVAAVLLGAGIAYLAKLRGHNRVAVAVCGAPGPALVAVAYLIAGPGSRPEAGDQFLPYLAAPYTVLTGLLGSLLVAAIERPSPEDSSATALPGPAPASDAVPAAGPERSDVAPDVGTAASDPADAYRPADPAGTGGTDPDASLDTSAGPSAASFAGMPEPTRSLRTTPMAQGEGPPGHDDSSDRDTGTTAALPVVSPSQTLPEASSPAAPDQPSPAVPEQPSSPAVPDKQFPAPPRMAPAAPPDQSSSQPSRFAGATPEASGESATGHSGWPAGVVGGMRFGDLGPDSAAPTGPYWGPPSTADPPRPTADPPRPTVEPGPPAVDPPLAGPGSVETTGYPDNAPSPSAAPGPRRSGRPSPSPKPVPEAPPEAEPSRELDEDEAWLQQIRGDDDTRHFRPAPPPKPPRRRWSLFSEDDEIDQVRPDRAANGDDQRYGEGSTS